jgi:hypothetical protein
MGTNAFGAQADSGGALTVGGGSISTAGQGAHALFVSAWGSQANLSGTESFATHGDGAVGLFVTNGGGLTATGPITINTAGGVLSTSLGPVGAFGVEADGEGSQINLAATTIATTGEASDGLGTGHGGVITVSGPLGVVTGGSSAYGAWAQSTGSAITLNGPSTFTINSGAFALLASEGGVISTADTMGVVVNGVAAGGVEANGSGSSATLKGPTTIALDGNQNTGLLAMAGGAISTQGPTSMRFPGSIHGRASALGRGHSFGLAERHDVASVFYSIRAARDFAVDHRLGRRNRLRRRQRDHFHGRRQRRRDLRQFQHQEHGGRFDFR